MKVTVQYNEGALTRAFAELEQLGYFAKQNFTCCQTCGWAEVPEAKADRAVFYHEQDTECLQETGGTYLAWSGDGAEIVKVLERHGLTVTWNGSESTRIYVELPKS